MSIGKDQYQINGSYKLVDTTALLGANAVYTSQRMPSTASGGLETGWFDNESLGTLFVEVSAYTDQASAANGVKIQETDRIANTNLINTVAQGSVVANTLFKLYGSIKARFWRVTYTNGATPQTVFELTVNGSQNIPFNVDATTGTATVIVSGGSSTSDVNIAQVRGTTTVQGGTAGSLGVGGIVATTGSNASVNPILIAGTTGSGDGAASQVTSLRTLSTGVIALGQAFTAIDAVADANTSALIITTNGTSTSAAGRILTRQEIFNGTTWDRVKSASSTTGTTGTGLVGAGILGKYQASPTTLTDGQYGAVLLDSSGRIATIATVSPTIYTEFPQVTKANIKNAAGVVKSIYISNSNAAIRYFQLHNKATAPAAADVPLLSFPIGAGTTNNPSAMELGTDFFNDAGISFSTGIGWAISTTYATFTDSATNTDHVAVVNYT